MPGMEIMHPTSLWQCPETTEHIWSLEDDIEHPLYECADDGVFSRRNTENEDHRCPDCNKFGSKVSDYSCPEDCDVEMTELLAYQIDGDGEYYLSLTDARGEDQ